MQNENDSLARTAHVFGMTDLEFEQRAQLESELAAQQVIRARMELDFPPAEDLPMPPPLPEGVRPLPRVENSPSELDELVDLDWD
tara:strand:- start:1361 stop:1615 length:255 start_codon:yes stop_codon:yes gene_type:complete